VSGKLAGRTAVVTGASKGLGKAIAVALAAEGARVALVARGRDDLEAAVAEITGAGGSAMPLALDITDEEQVRTLEREVAAAFGRVNILVNNAGINIRKPVPDFTLDEWRRVMDTNVTAAFLMCRSFIPHMSGNGYGRIINMASTMAHVSLPMRAAYSASKAALLGMTRAMALDLAAQGITCNTISPGPFATEMNRTLIESGEASALLVANTPVGRWGRVEEVGQLAVYLCSDDAGFVTGADLLIDGGWCAK
jgi:NAD(P)-dependent dehydrogenase (short-subunit alcohol dehydrogenase family)